MEPTFDYQAFGFGIIVGALGLIIFIRVACLVYDWRQRRIHRKFQEARERVNETIKRLIMEEAIQELEDHANWEDE